MSAQTKISGQINWGCLVPVCFVFLIVYIGVSNFVTMEAMKNCDGVEHNVDSIRHALEYYWDDTQRTDVPSLEILKKEKYLSGNVMGHLFGSSPCTITIITSSEPKRCPRGKYYVLRNMRTNWGEWVDEWPADMDLASAETDNLADEDKYRLANEAYVASSLASNKLLDPEEIHTKLIGMQFRSIEEILKDVESKFNENIEYEYLFLNSYELFCLNEANNYLELGTYFDKWVEETDSYMAYAARGTYYKNRAYDYRGSGYINTVSEDNLEMARRYWNLAVLDFKKSISLNSRLLPAYSQIVRTMRSMGKRSEAEVYVKAVLDIYPESYYIRYHYLKFLQPKWGGSHEEAFAFIRESQDYGHNNPRIWALRGYVYSSMAYNYMVDENYICAVENYSKALDYGDNKAWLANTARALWLIGEYDASVSTMEKIRPYALSPAHLESTIRFLKESIKKENFYEDGSPDYHTFEQYW